MTFGEYVEKLNNFLKENPKAKDLDVVYASDPEGNDYYTHFCDPQGVKRNNDDWETRDQVDNIDEAEEICIN